MRGQDSLAEVLFAQQADEELSRVGVATKLCGVCAEAISVVGVRRCSILSCMWIACQLPWLRTAVLWIGS